jgi:hypothetical protein
VPTSVETTLRIFEVAVPSRSCDATVAEISIPAPDAISINCSLDIGPTKIVCLEGGEGGDGGGVGGVGGGGIGVTGVGGVTGVTGVGGTGVGGTGVGGAGAGIVGGGLC